MAQGDGTYECQVLVRGMITGWLFGLMLGMRLFLPGVQTCPTHQVSVENLPDVKGYASSDAFIKHPTIEGMYKVYVAGLKKDVQRVCSRLLACLVLVDWMTS